MAEFFIFFIVLWHGLSILPSRRLRWFLLTPHYLVAKSWTNWYERTTLKKGWPKHGYLLDGYDLRYDHEVTLLKKRVFVELPGIDGE